MKRYIVFTPYYMANGEVYFVNEGLELNELLSYLDGQRIHKDVNQSLLSIYKVIEENKKYPTTIKELVKVMNERIKDPESENFIIRWEDSSLGEYKLDGNKSREGIEEKLVELTTAGETDILILNADEAKDAENFYKEHRNKMLIGLDKEEATEKTIFFVTAFEKLSKTENGEYDLGDKLIIGVSEDIEDARSNLRKQEKFIRGNLYKFVIIEEIFIGMRPFTKKYSETYSDGTLSPKEENDFDELFFKIIDTPDDFKYMTVGL
ncbi:hypothetical protein AAGG74_19190 [Bacillus mexicanus]|uniref:hypothetical protein n=1 Tax=Bacillus mexicanus TaxID=2834415 RepID=UPI003D24CC09